MTTANTTTTGSCLCGTTRYSFTGDPVMQAACHCTLCRKQTGTTHSTNLIIPRANFTFHPASNGPHSSPHTSIWSRPGQGGDVKVHFCSNCHTRVAGFPDAMGPMMYVPLGTIDNEDFVMESKPQAEVWTAHRVRWVPQYEGAQQFEAQPEMSQANKGGN